MRRALERDEFEPYYQPQLNLATNRCIGVEALVRWHHPERGLLAAGEFIPIADASGVSLALDAWVLREACRQARACCDRGQQLRVAINLSQAQLCHADIVATVEATLETTGASADCLELEITERFRHGGFCETTDRNLQALAAREIELVLDDFGQGHSSLASLCSLPVSKIKIGRAFIAGIGTVEQDDAGAGANHSRLPDFTTLLTTPRPSQTIRANIGRTSRHESGQLILRVALSRRATATQFGVQWRPIPGVQSRRKKMRGCAPAAIAILALEACAPGTSAERSASRSADLAAVRSECAATAMTRQDYADCLAARWPYFGNECDYAGCVEAQRAAVRATCTAHVVFSKYADCVGRGENRIGPDWVAGRS